MDGERGIYGRSSAVCNPLGLLMDLEDNLQGNRGTRRRSGTARKGSYCPSGGHTQGRQNKIQSTQGRPDGGAAS